MRTIKIRFVKTKNANYHLQRKGWFGRWKDIGYSVDMGYGSVTYEYSAVTKEELLNEVLEKYYEVDKKFVKVIEHATIKIY